MDACSLPWREPLEAFHALRDRPFSILFHGDGENGRWSAIFAYPRLEQTGAGPEETLAWSRAQLLDLPPPSADRFGSPFRPGAAGILAFDPGSPNSPASCSAALFDLVLVFDRQLRRVYLLEAARAEPRRRRQVLDLLEEPIPPPAVKPKGYASDVEPRTQFGQKVERVRARIARGEIYQANISRRFEGRLGPGDHPYDLFRRLAVASPASWATYVRLPECAVVSNSPERLVRVRVEGFNRVARASPIKGTAPRGGTPAEDARNARELQASPKDRAENLMIVDLMRNDLSVSCKPGSVRVPFLFELKTLPNVHHLISHVEGVLTQDQTAVDLLGASFPAGSITGAPKHRAMSTIREIEGAPRGYDYGSVFWAGDDGELDSSVLIRTATCRPTSGGWSVSFRVGCGITSDSDPEAETRESEAKASKLLEAICGGAP